MRQNERRAKERIRPVEGVKYSLVYRISRRPIHFEATDVSDIGVGGKGLQQITVGSEAILIIDGQEVELISVWSRAIQGDTHYFYTGLRVTQGLGILKQMIPGESEATA